MSQLAIPTISDLPPEILSEIFLLNTSVESFYGVNHVIILQDTTRYTSQVCRQWRFLVLENPVIWSRVIDFSGSYLWTEELLRRASNHPLTLVSRYRSLSSDTLARELEHVSQFGRYDGVFTAGTWPLVLDKFQQPAPYLEELRLRGSIRSSSAKYKLPASIFSGNAPRLRQLWLQLCSFDDDLPYLAQLTHLSQVSLRNSPPKKWLDILSRMKFLTDLELRGVNVGTESHAAVHLPNLENITLSASLRECSAFLSCLILKPTCRMRVTAQDSRPGIDFDVTAGIIAQKLQLYLIKAIESNFPLYLRFRNDDFFVCNRVRSPTGGVLEPEIPPYVSFYASWPSGESGLLSILPHVSSAFARALSQVTSLELWVNSTLATKTHSAFASVLGQANNVTSLARLNEQTANIFLQLEGVRRPINPQTKGDVIFPSLRTIHFTELGIQSTDCILQSLVDFIRYRISIAAPMKEVYYANLSHVSWVQIGMECLRETGVLVAQRDWV